MVPSFERADPDPREVQGAAVVAAVNLPEGKVAEDVAPKLSCGNRRGAA